MQRGDHHRGLFGQPVEDVNAPIRVRLVENISVRGPQGNQTTPDELDAGHYIVHLVDGKQVVAQYSTLSREEISLVVSRNPHYALGVEVLCQKLPAADTITRHLNF